MAEVVLWVDLLLSSLAHGKSGSVGRSASETSSRYP